MTRELTEREQQMLTALRRIAFLRPVGATPKELKMNANWQPIETAPKNRAVLVHMPGCDYYGNNGVYAGMLVDMGSGPRWMTFGWAIGRDVGADNAPTEWAPLPEPPAS